MQFLRNHIKKKEQNIIKQSNYAVETLEESWSLFVKEDTYLSKEYALNLLKVIHQVDIRKVVPWYLFWNLSLQKKLTDNMRVLNRLKRTVKSYNEKFIHKIVVDCKKTESKINNVRNKIEREFELILKNVNFLNYKNQEKEIEELIDYIKEIKGIKNQYQDMFNISLQFVDQLVQKYSNYLNEIIDTNLLFLEYKKIIINSNDSLNKINNIFSKLVKEDIFLDYERRDELERFIDKAKNDISFSMLNQRAMHNEFVFIVQNLRDKINIESQRILNYNQNFILEKKREYKNLFKKGNLVLDNDQQTAIITDDKHNLVVAGAGSGKTEVLITRIAYLIKRKSDKIKPNKILALAFQNKAAEEIKERLQKRYKIDVEIRTFHSLGKKIIEDVSKRKGSNAPKLKPECSEDWKYQRYIQTLFNKEVTKNENFQNDIISFMKNYGDEEVIKKREDFEKKEEFYNYQRALTYTALDGTKVKSEAEREILNFFLMHKLNNKDIKIIYENPAEWMRYKNKDGEVIIPKPDFYFPDFDIYLEHWAIGKNGKVPEWFAGDNPTKHYKEAMDIKKKKYLANNKLLFETTQADYQTGNFHKILAEKFISILKIRQPNKKQVLKSLSYKELVDAVWDCAQFVKQIPLNTSRFIVIAKTYRLYPKDIKKRLENEIWSPKQYSFAHLANHIYVIYQKEFQKGNYIDFSDMINVAVDFLKQNEDFYKNKYDHILIDEYQDISTQRYEMIKELMNKNSNCKLFCVGDDWQSIMGFAGSNLDFFINFNKYFPHPARTDLIKNYRSIKSIVDVGACIIKNNKIGQIQKKTVSNSEDSKPILVFSSKHQKKFYDRYYQQIAKHCLDKIKEYHTKLKYSYGDFMILMRIANKKRLRNFISEYAKLLGIPISENVNKPNCVRIMSVHKSKGLQARVVMVLNVDKDLYGFPCELENPEIFMPAIKNNDGLLKQEERRLFYVAVTRAKEEVMIYTQKYSESEFITEIKEFVKREELGY
jgi:DNA helicase IV